MCVDPLSATAIIGGSSVLSAVGSYMSSEAQAGADRANAQAALAAGYQNENLQRDQSRRQMASQLAALSARGESLDSGTPLALMADSARNAEVNALTIRANAINKAQVYDYQASTTMQMAPITAAGQLLNGASKMAQLGQT